MHLIRHSLKYVPRREREQVARDLKPIYTAVDADHAHQELEAFDEKWGARFPVITQDDDVGVHISRHGKDHGGDVVVSIRDPRLCDESGAGGSLRAVGGGVECGLIAASVPSSR